VNLEINGTPYTNFISARCELRLDSLSSSFSFQADAGESVFPFRVGDACRVIADGFVILTGYVEIIEHQYSATSHTVTVSGRDKTADLLDSTVNPIDDLRGEQLELKAVIQAVLDDIGANLSVIDNALPAPFTAAETVASPEAGDRAFSFIEKYSRKRQVLLTSDEQGNVQIDKNRGLTADGVVQHVVGRDDNNVISADFSIDSTGRYNLYKMVSQLNYTALNNAGETETATAVNQSGLVTDPEIRPGRQLVFLAETAGGSEDDQKRADWERNIRRARGLLYNATVKGYRVGNDSGDVWRVNRLYKIDDSYLGAAVDMLLNAATFSYNLDEGKTTSLQFVDKDSYATEQPQVN
jgi:prophage tail gpP-like protein